MMFVEHYWTLGCLPPTTLHVATIKDAAMVADRLRPEDREELLAATGEDPAAHLQEGVRDSRVSYLLRVCGEPAALYGILDGDLMGLEQSVGWLVTTDVVERFPLTFWRLCKLLVPEIVAEFGPLTNWIDVRHTKALRWAKRLGFQLGEPQPYGPEGRLFVPFVVGGA